MSPRIVKLEEEALRRYFVGALAAPELAKLILVDGKGDVTHYSVTDMGQRFVVRPTHLVAVCDGYLSGDLHAMHLQAIGFCLLSSEHFEWSQSPPDGERLATVATDWSSPEINLPITRENVLRWKAFLLGQLAFL